MFTRGKLAAAYRTRFFFAIGMMKAAEADAARRTRRDFLPFVWIPRITDFHTAIVFSFIADCSDPTAYRFPDGITTRAAFRKFRRRRIYKFMFKPIHEPDLLDAAVQGDDLIDNLIDKIF